MSDLTIEKLKAARRALEENEVPDGFVSLWKDDEILKAMKRGGEVIMNLPATGPKVSVPDFRKPKG